MRIKEGQIFNLMDTNGRRNDVIHALQGYLTILEEIQNNKKMRWASIPDSFAQYEFYRQAIELSPDVFVKHDPYDKLMEQIKKIPDFNEAVENLDLGWIQRNYMSYPELVGQFDLGIEDRARHYTSNLVKLGFADDDRDISPVGKLLLDPQKIKKDELEKLLPVDGVNIVYLRQLLKLRLFDSGGERFYAPFHLAIFVLLKRTRLSENEFSELVQGLNPYSDFTNIEDYVVNYREGDIVSDIEIDIPEELKTQEKISETVFRKFYKNRKSKTAVDVYWEFYDRLWKYVHEEKNPDKLDSVLTFYEDNRAMLNKAFGRGKNLFSLKTGDRPSFTVFDDQHPDILTLHTNEYLYIQFSLSKILDQIREYSDTTKRIFKASGMIRFYNGFVELAYRELCSCIFEVEFIRSRISGNVSEETHSCYRSQREYEGGLYSYYCEVVSLSEILRYTKKEITQVKDHIREEFPDTSMEKIPFLLAEKRKKEFALFLERSYPAEKVKEILRMFADRSHDRQIKEMVSQDASVPTIYEYIVGIAWYYFSGKRIDLLGSYNLTLSADFEPLVHAGGGQGDIVIYEKDKVVMLEATLMNANSQKRGEWEPVLRHSINLKVEEETAKTGRVVTSFFIADRFDYNTINIWKAIAAVPLQSTVERDKFTDNVVIMPVHSEELCSLMDQHREYDAMISRVHQLFEVDKVNFDINWRDKFMEKVIDDRAGGLC
ncbi:MAG: AlwI family type II restriction endonuclease [Eubacterium sp.]|nr:AlwI family type II restriction endonuclease [Eubacterium sp.]